MAQCKCGRNDFGSVPGDASLVVCNSCKTYYASDDAGGKPVTVNATQQVMLDKARAEADEAKAANLAARAAQAAAAADANADDGDASDDTAGAADTGSASFEAPRLPANQYWCNECGRGHVRTSWIGIEHAPA